ncbi:RNA polymerase sigma factor [Georgenia alba]|uniref:RNA polymerase sigma factor n=1 Tax=Georgenia alba TaxID=2233858 RepID=A0ABW2QCL6_9MICO
MDARRSIEAVWRIECPRLIAALTRLVRDVGLAEELASEAFVAALESWPTEGIPPRPGGWLMSTARHKAVDRIRREENLRRKYAQLAPVLDRVHVPAEGALEAVDDDLLALLFTACHPVLPRESRVALTLRLLGGLRTEEVARAFLVPPATVGQRISRAKRTLAEAQVPFEKPSREELPERLGAVLEVIYLVFNEGYSPSSGEVHVRADLAGEAMRLGRVLVGLLPREPEVLGLAALMELQASRFAARADAAGAPVTLEEQDRRRWDRTLIAHGLGLLDRAAALRKPLGPYTIQAAIAACHARAVTFQETDWERIAALYDALAQLTPSPVVELNRAVAVLHVDGPGPALEVLDAVRDDKRLARYHLVGAVRAEILTGLGRHEEAAAELEGAADLAPTRHERELLRRRMSEALRRQSAPTA